MNGYQNEQASWKRLLRGAGPKVPESRKMLCQLWNRLDGINNLAAQLDSIIDGTRNLEPWIDAFVRTPAAISYCWRRFIRWNNKDEIYLLQATQMNGTHAELFTYCLYNRLATLRTNNRFEPFQSFYYYAVNSTEFEPGIVLEFPYDNKLLRFDIKYRSGNYIVFIQCHKVTPYPLIEATLRDQLGFLNDATNYIRQLTPDHIESFILELGEKLSVTPSPEQ